MKHVRRLSFILFFLLFALSVNPPLFAQTGEENWLEAATNGRLTIDQIPGKSSFGAHPVLSATLQNPSADSPISVQIASGEILQPATPGYCSVLLAGLEAPIVLEAGQRISQDLTAYCLELPDPNNARRPDEAANYVPLNFSPASQVPSNLSEILTRAKEANLLESYATQLAIWQQHANLADFTELTTRLGQNNLESYRDQVTLLVRNTSASPATTSSPASDQPAAEATPVAEEVPGASTPQPAVAEEATPDTAPSEDNIDPTGLIKIDSDWGMLTMDTSTLLMIGGLCGGAFLLLFVAMWFFPRRSPAPAPKKNRPSEPQIPTPTRSGEPEVDDPYDPYEKHENRTTSHRRRCKYCGQKHDSRRCPNRQQRRADGYHSPKADATVPTVGPSAKAKTSSPPPSTANRPSTWGPSHMGSANDSFRRSSAQPSSASVGQAKSQSHQRSNQDDFFEDMARQYINEGDASTITEPSFGASVAGGSTPSSDTVPNSTPPVTYVISDSQNSNHNRSYLNGTSGLLARDDLYTRQIVLDHDSSISSPHAVIRFEKNGRVTVRDLRSSNGTFVNGQPLLLGTAVEVANRSRIRFGPSSEYELDLSQRRLLSMNGNRPFDLSQESLWLVTRHRLRKTITFNNKQLSNPHLLIRPSDPDRPLSFKLRDLGSSNGSFINGKDLRQMRDGTFIAEREVNIEIGGHPYKIEAQWIKMAFKSGNLIGNRYTVEKQIYMGVMSELYLVKDNQSPNEQPMAAKVPNTRQYGEDRVGPAFEREIKLMTTLKHANLLQGNDSHIASEVDDSYLIMPYIDGYDLKTIMTRLRQKQSQPEGLGLADVREIFDKLLSAVEYLHEEGWIHCDLKPDNILLSKEGQVFLIDLGAATAIDKPASFHNRAYSAPETGSARVVNEASDIYSLGKILFELLTNQDPKVLGQLSMSEASNLGAPIQDTTASSQSKNSSNPPVGLHALLQKPEHGRDFAHIISKTTSQAPIDRYPDVEALREALADAYTRPMSKASLDQNDVPQLAKFVQQL